MTLHADLLAQASDLANKEPKKPKQASLRRAVSAAYYAVFHFLIDEACGLLVSGGGADVKKIRSTLARAFTHTQMRATSQAFVQNPQQNPWARLFAPIPADLVTIARTFVDLQQARHEADYDLGRRWARSEVQALISRAEQALASWSSTSSHGASRAYLVGMLVQAKQSS